MNLLAEAWEYDSGSCSEPFFDLQILRKLPGVRSNPVWGFQPVDNRFALLCCLLGTIWKMTTAHPPQKQPNINPWLQHLPLLTAHTPAATLLRWEELGSFPKALQILRQRMWKKDH